MENILESEKTVYNNLPIPSLDTIISLEQYKFMTKFDMNDRKTIGKASLLCVPDRLLEQYVGKDRYENSDLPKNMSGLWFWHSSRGAVTKMIIIPEMNYDLLRKIGDPAKEFIDYFENKTRIIFQNYNDLVYRIIDIDKKFRHPETRVRFIANNEVYIRLEKIIT